MGTKARAQIDHPAHYGGANNAYEAIRKTCSTCELQKMLGEFPPDMRCKDGRSSKCRECARRVAKDFYTKYPAKEAQRRLSNAIAGKRWYQRNRKHQIHRFKWGHVRRKYGLSESDYQRLLVTQDGLCAICGVSEPGRGDGHFAIDHCHRTGAVRGLLCQRCNTGLGFFKDEPTLMRKAAVYVEKQ